MAEPPFAAITPSRANLPEVSFVWRESSAL
jgi:hypothetical protein